MSTATPPSLPFQFFGPTSPTLTISPVVIDYFNANSNGGGSATPAALAVDALQAKMNEVKITLERSTPDKPYSTLFATNSDDDVTTSLPNLLSQVLQLTSSSQPSSFCVTTKRTPYHTTFKIENYIQLASYAYFLEHGTLLPLEDVQKIGMISDEEYLCGIIGFVNNDLTRYCIGRAIVRDVHSITLASELTKGVFEILSEFDFRNGNVRRRFDGVKYSVRKGINILYELAITERDPNTLSEDNVEPQLKKLKTDNTTPTPQQSLNRYSFAQMQSRSQAYDAKREVIIKRSREIQKASKNSIFAIHRNDLTKAKSMLAECVKVGLEINAVLEGEEGRESLKSGAYSSSLEEYAEALLFLTWVENKTVMAYEDFAGKGLPIDVEEYVGGLCDLTGEVGRVAVIEGTKRSESGVRSCLDTNLSILFALEGVLNGGKLGKKLEPLKESVRKLEMVLYELSLIKSKGGGEVNVTEEKEIVGKGRNDDE